MSWIVAETDTYERYTRGEGIHALIDRYPLLPIRDEADYQRASAVLTDLFGRDDLDDEADGYLDTLLKLLSDYEGREHAIEDSMSPAQIVRHLMEANGLNVDDIGRIIGSQSAAGYFLDGKVGLSVRRAERLTDHFRLSSDALLPSREG